MDNPFKVDAFIERKKTSMSLPDGRQVGIAAGPEDTRVFLKRDLQEGEKEKLNPSSFNPLFPYTIDGGKLISGFVLKNDTARALAILLIKELGLEE